MPLQVISAAMGLPDVVVHAEVPRWLFAETLNLFGVSLLFVRKTPLVRDDDPIYSSVADLMNRSLPELLWEGYVADPSMYWGKAVGLVYLLHPAEGIHTPDDYRVLELIQMCRDLGEPVPAYEIAQKLKARIELALGGAMQ